VAKRAISARASITEAGLAALRRLVYQRRGVDPVQFAHVRQELGLHTSTSTEVNGSVGS
jgi:hypothetical protein